jgi:glutamyl-tRNA synthetase
LIEEMGLKPRIAFTAIRIATTGSTISPPLFESMELLGKEVSLARIAAALTL